MAKLSEYQFWVRVVRIAAAVLGATIALWLLGGDRDPDAARLADQPYSQLVTIRAHEAYDFRDLGFFEFRAGAETGGDKSGTGWVCSGDNDLAVTQWMSQHRNQRVLWTMQVFSPLRRDADVK